jgi:hypothetical protein
MRISTASSFQNIGYLTDRVSIREYLRISGSTLFLRRSSSSCLKRFDIIAPSHTRDEHVPAGGQEIERREVEWEVSGWHRGFPADRTTAPRILTGLLRFQAVISYRLSGNGIKRGSGMAYSI